MLAFGVRFSGNSRKKVGWKPETTTKPTVPDFSLGDELTNENI
jgi:hypothetical protein